MDGRPHFMVRPPGALVRIASSSKAQESPTRILHPDLIPPVRSRRKAIGIEVPRVERQMCSDPVCRWVRFFLVGCAWDP